MLTRKQTTIDAQPFAIIDHRAVMKWMHYAGKDTELGVVSEVTGRLVNSPEHTCRMLVERVLEPLLADLAPRNIIVVHDGGHNYRTRLYPEYKVKPASPVCEVDAAAKETVHSWLKRFYKAAGILQCGVKGVEADDVIAHLCKGLPGSKVVYTVDADLLQVVNETTSVYLKDELYMYGDEYKGISLGDHNCIAIYKAIVGDSSDGYGGVPSMGQAAWERLSMAYGHDGMKEIETAAEENNRSPVEEAYNATSDKYLGKLLDNWDVLRHQLKLAQLAPFLCEKPAGKKLTKIEWIKRVPNHEALKALLAEVKAGDLYSVFACFEPSEALLDATTLTDALISEIKEKILASPFVAFDYEAYDENKFKNFEEANDGKLYVDMLSQSITGGSLSFGRNLEETVYVTVNHADSANLPLDVLKELVLFAYTHRPVVAHNALYELTVTEVRMGEVLEGVYDTMIMSSYVNENSRSGLKFLSKSLLNFDQTDYETTLAAEGAEDMSQITAQGVLKYGLDDAIVTSALFDLMYIILNLEGMWTFYEEDELYVANVLSHSYQKGADIDWDLLSQLHADDRKLVEYNSARIHEILETRCSEGSVLDYSGAEAFISQERGFFEASLRASLKERIKSGKEELGGKSLQEWLSVNVKKRFENWKNNILASVVYTPPSQETTPYAFIPTATKLKAVTQLLGFKTALEKDTQKGVSEWLVSVTAISDDVEPLTSEQIKFCKLLGAANKQLKRREGDAYTELVEFASAQFPPTITETGDTLDLNSAKKMQQLLYCKLGLPIRITGKVVKGTARHTHGCSGSPSSDEKAMLMAIANDCSGENAWKKELLQLVIEAKAALTRISLYHVPYPLWKHPLTGKIHPNIRNCGTVTRRPSGNSPNILQVSKKSMMRAIFLPPTEDHVVVAIDYATQEIRLLACESGDPEMTSVYQVGNEKDMHCLTGAKIVGMTYEAFLNHYSDENAEYHSLAAEIRTSAKGVNFGLAYGIAANALSRNITVSVAEATRFLDGALALYSRIPEWQKETAEFGKKHGYVLNAFGQRRHVTDDLFSSDRAARSRVERQLANFKIQGTAADMLKKVLTRLWKSRLLFELDMVFFAPVYDETVAFVHKEDVMQYVRSMCQFMAEATPPSHSIPQIPEVSIGPNWKKLKELGREPADEAILEALDLSTNYSKVA